MTSRSGARQPESATRSGHRYQHIDAMRAYAVLVVVVAHAGLGHIVPGGSGVTIFFAISGFIITHLVLRERMRTGGFSVRGFYLRRFYKLAPPFLVIVAIPTAIYSLSHEVHVGPFLAQVFFVFNWLYMIHGDAYVLPGSGVIWSLAIEEQFYIGYAILCVFAMRGARYVKALALLACVGVLGPLAIRLYLGVTDLDHHRTYYGTDTRLDGIAIGVVAALLFHEISRGRFSALRRIFESDWVFAAAVFGYLFSLILRDDFFRETFRYSIQATASSAIILWGFLGHSSRWEFFIRVASWRPIQLVGLASYSIYLCHLSLNRAILTVLGRDEPVTALIPVLVVAGVVCGLLVWHFIERPVAAWKAARQRSTAVGASHA